MCVCVVSGYGFVESWRSGAEVVMGHSLTAQASSDTDKLGSTVVCGVNFAAQQSCVMENVIVDFAKVHRHTGR
jgi:hypothetical protein